MTLASSSPWPAPGNPRRGAAAGAQPRHGFAPHRRAGGGAWCKAVPPAHRGQRADAGRRALPRRCRAHGGRHDRRALRNRRRRRDVSGTVRIGAPDGFGVAYLAPRLGALTAQHRDLKIQLVPVPRSFSLSRREADIAITAERPAEGRLVAAKLVDYSLGLYASRAYAEAHGLPQSPAELPRPYAGRLRARSRCQPVARLCQRVQRGWDARFAISSALGQVEAVRSGAGIGILHAFIARSCPTSCRSRRSSRSAAPTGWSTMSGSGRCAGSRRWPDSFRRSRRKRALFV